MKKTLIFSSIVIMLIIAVYMAFGSMQHHIIFLLSQLKNTPVQFSIYSVLILISDIVLPVPSSIIMYLNGFVLGVPGGSLLSFISLITSSVIGYYLGRLGQRKHTNEPDKMARNFVNRYGAFAIIISKGIPILSETICIISGYNGMPFKRYILLNAIGYIPVCILYAFFGYLGKSENNFLFAFVCSLFVSILFWLLGKKLLTGMQEV